MIEHKYDERTVDPCLTLGQAWAEISRQKMARTLLCAGRGWDDAALKDLRAPFEAHLASVRDLSRSELQLINLNLGGAGSAPLYVGLSVAGWYALRKEGPLLRSAANDEERRERAATMLQGCVSFLTQLAASSGRQLVLTAADIAFTDASARALPHRPEPRWLERVHLSFTRTTHRGPQYLARFPHLKELYLDHCPALKKERNVFGKLLGGAEFASLELLSVVGVSDALSSSWLDDLQRHAPRLRLVYFTRAPGSKALGWTDAVLMQTMRQPCLLPCGHLGDLDSTRQLRSCPFCRRPLRPALLLPVNPHMTKLERPPPPAPPLWTASVCDVTRAPLGDRALYHVRCGSFYGLPAARQVLDLEESVGLLTEAHAAQLGGCACLGCWTLMQPPGVRLALLAGTEALPNEARHFEDGAEAVTYAHQGAADGLHYVPPWEDGVIGDMI